MRSHARDCVLYFLLPEDWMCWSNGLFHVTGLWVIEGNDATVCDKVLNPRNAATVNMHSEEYSCSHWRRQMVWTLLILGQVYSLIIRSHSIHFYVS